MNEQSLAQRGDSTGLLAQYEQPAEVIARFTDWSNHLMAVVEDKKLFTIIEGKKYLHAEAWEIIMGFDGACIDPVDPVPIIEDGTITGFQVKVNIIKGGVIHGGGIAQYYFDENACRGREGRAKNMACLSAAQTRALSKACRMKYSPVAVMAGYQPTPAEEMQGITKTSQPSSGNMTCPKHNVEWFQRGRMKGLAHPVTAPDGGTGWCNRDTVLKEAKGTEPEAEASIGTEEDDEMTHIMEQEY